MFEISCPSCGTPISFRRESSLYATCPSCSSVLLRKDVNVELLGKAADLQPDNTPLQVGTRGQYKGQAFEIVGRIQIRQEEGFWNEWYLNYRDGRDGWLGEALGEYFVSFAVREPGLPQFGSVKLNDLYKFQGVDYYAVNIGASVVSSYEGELPFLMNGSYKLPYVDLRSHGKRAATLDYSDGDPLLFLGTYEEFEDLHFENLRDPEDHVQKRSAAQAASLKCPTCGAPHTLSSAGPQSQTLACAYCGTGLDISQSGEFKVLWQITEKIKSQPKPKIRLGTKGVFKGVEWEVIGYQCKYSQEGKSFYPWQEYLCYERCHGYRYLVYSQGKWSWSQTLHELPSHPQDIKHAQTVRGKTFTHSEGYTGHVAAVHGEFPYKVDVKAQSDIQDYVCGSFTLSRERDLVTENPEVYWSLSEAADEDEVRQAFKASGKSHRNKRKAEKSDKTGESLKGFTCGTGCLTFILGLLFCLFMQFQEKEIYKQQFDIETGKEPSVVTQEFKVEGRTQPLEIAFSTDLDNRWLFFDISLINTQTQEATVFQKAVSYYHGVDSEGESWSEGSCSESIVVPRVKPGTYVLALLPQTGTGHDPDVLQASSAGRPLQPQKRLASVTMTVTAPTTYWGLFLFIFTFLILPFPCYYWVMEDN